MKETLDACASVHGGSVDEKQPTLDGIWITLVNVATPTALSNYIANSKKVMKRALPKVIKDRVKSFEASPENKIRSAKVLYCKKLLSKEQYKNIRMNLAMKSSSENKTRTGLQFMPKANLPKLLSYDKLIEFIKSIDIGNVKDVKEEFCADLEEDMKVDGAYRELESFLKELASMYIQIDQLLGEKSTFMHFGSEPYHFRVAIGADGAPFGKDDEATAWLISFLNVGDQIASQSECFLIAGANCSESHISMIKYGQKLMSEIGNIENQIYYLSGETNENFRVKFTFDLVPSDMKWASSFSGELANSAFYFSPFGNVNDDNKDTVNGSLWTDEECTWKPWGYNERLEVAAKVEAKKNELSKTSYADSTKRNFFLDFIRNHHSRQETVPILGQLVDKVFAEPLHNANNAWQQLNQLIIQHACAKSAIPKACTNLSDLPECQFSKYLATLKQIGATRLYKKVKKWFSQGRNGPLNYRFTGKETKILCHKYMYLLRAISCNGDGPPDNLRIAVLAFVGLQLRNATSRFLIDETVLHELQECCKKYFNACSILLGRITPTVWTIGYAVPYHTELLFRNLGVGLGMNTMQGREAKHVRISDYAKHSTRTTRWKLVMRHDFISNVWLRKHDPLRSSYKKCKDVYVPPEIDQPNVCNCGLEMDSKLNHHRCSICSSELYKCVQATAESGELDPNIKNLLSVMS